MKDEEKVIVYTEGNLLNMSQIDAILNGKTLWFQEQH